MEYLILAGLVVLAVGYALYRIFRPAYLYVSEWQARFYDELDQAGADWG